MKKIKLSIVMILLTILLVGCKPLNIDRTEYKYTSTEAEVFISKEIVSLELVYKTEGNFSGDINGKNNIIDGRIKDNLYYLVYAKENENEYFAYEYDASITSLVETKSTPHVKEKVKSVVVDTESLRGSTMGDRFYTYIDNDPLLHAMPDRKDIHLKVEVNNKTIILPISYSRYSIGKQVYTSIDLENVDKDIKDTLIEIFPDLKDEGKTLLISIKGNNNTLFVPEETIVNKFNIEF